MQPEKKRSHRNANGFDDIMEQYNHLVSMKLNYMRYRAKVEKKNVSGMKHSPSSLDTCIDSLEEYTASVKDISFSFNQLKNHDKTGPNSKTASNLDPIKDNHHTPGHTFVKSSQILDKLSGVDDPRLGSNNHPTTLDKVEAYHTPRSTESSEQCTVTPSRAN